MYGRGDLIAGERNGMYGRTGSDCPNWKGGRHVRKDGYVRVTVDGTRILEHRYLLSKAGEDLTGKVVHHKDHNPTNNSLANLQVLDCQAEHVRLHALERKDAVT